MNIAKEETLNDILTSDEQTVIEMFRLMGGTEQDLDLIMRLTERETSSGN